MKKILLIAGVIVFVIQLQAQQINIPKGLMFESVGSANMDMEMMGQKMNMVTNSSMTTSTKEANDTGFLFANTIKRMTMKMDGMGQNVNFDSDKKEDMAGPVGSAMKNVVGSVQEIGVNKQGKITSLSGHSDVSNNITDAMNMAGRLSVGIPYYMLIPQSGKKISVGDNWIDSSGTANTIHFASNYTLKNVTATDITIAFDGTIILNQPIQQQGVTVNTDIKGNMKGESVYDKATGLLKTNNSTFTMAGTMEVMGQSMPITMNGTSAITVKKS